MKYAIRYWLRSAFVREELLRVAVVAILFLWAVTATAVAMLKTDKTVLIGVSDTSSYVISEFNESTRRKEIVSFVTTFVSNYYEFSSQDHAEKISRAGDMMASSLWDLKRPELLKINERLKKDPLTQTVKIESIDLVSENVVHINLEALILRKLARTKVKLRSELILSPKPRTKENPWPIEIQEIKDAAL